MEKANWSWADTRLARLKELGIRPIAGLLHHGSGPRYTDLLDPQFPAKLAQYAAAFAARYPWVEDYTPINEPLTTARFSALYGHWYPHRRDDSSFAQALVNQCRGIVLAMREIRKVNSRARLIQTDDLGKVTATPDLQYQADYENERRWLSWDILCGRVKSSHSLWYFMRGTGISEVDLLWFAENPCPPDIIGINHYVLSNRFLDHRLDAYPERYHGGNSRHRYADVDAVRVAGADIALPETILREAWQRYQIPVAVTEVHMQAWREDQIRWFMEIWNSAQRLLDEGVDVRAITAWGLLGHFDWHCLLAACEGKYESGVFDLRSEPPRPTALAGMIESLTATGDYQHPLLALPGWWRRPERVLYPVPQLVKSADGASVQPLLITGGRGTLGRGFAAACELRAIPYRLLIRKEMDIADADNVAAILDELRPWAIVNAAGYVRVDDAEQDARRCYRENFDGPMILARLCADRDIPMISFSSDLVFDGRSASPYVETSKVSPLNVYGCTKAEADKAVLDLYPEALIIRTSAFFSPYDEFNFLTVALRHLRSRSPFIAASDVRVSPTYLPDLINTTIDLLLDGEQGLWHLAHKGDVSWFDFARQAAEAAGLDSSLLIAKPMAEFQLAANRPSYSVLGSQKGNYLPSLEEAMTSYLQAVRCD